MNIASSVYGDSGNMHGNAGTEPAAVEPVATTVPPVAVAATVDDRSPNRSPDDTKRSDIAEIEALRRNVERMNPELAKTLPMAGENMSAAEIANIKAVVAKTEHELAAQENQQMAQGIVGGALAMGGIGALLGGLSSTSNSNNISTATDGTPLISNELTSTTKDPKLAQLFGGDPIVLESGKTLVECGVGNACSASHEQNLAVPQGLPSLAANIAQTRSAGGAGRSITV